MHIIEPGKPYLKYEQREGLPGYGLPGRRLYPGCGAAAPQHINGRVGGVRDIFGGLFKKPSGEAQ